MSIKLNALHDKQILESFSSASEQLAIDVVARRICGLRPCVKGMIERDHVRVPASSSASSNTAASTLQRGSEIRSSSAAPSAAAPTDHRIEVVVPIEARSLKPSSTQPSTRCSSTTSKRLELQSDGSWRAFDGRKVSRVRVPHPLMRRARSRERRLAGAADQEPYTQIRR